jgi:superfamily I DNA and/or RNA helicase
LELVRAMLPEAAAKLLPAVATGKDEYAQLHELLSTLLQPARELAQAQGRVDAQVALAQQWKKVFGHPPDEFARPLFERAKILAATCLIVGGKELRMEDFDWAIVDEAGRATPPELLVPLVRARRAILVGDERQLPPMLDEALEDGLLAERQVARKGLEVSLFETLTSQGRDRDNPVAAVQTLRVQHRMHPAIGRLISEVFYDGVLQQGVTADERAHGLSWLARAVVWLSTTSLPDRFESRHGTGYRNLCEVEIIRRLAARIDADLRAMGQPGQRRSMAVLAPYQAQVAALQDQLLPHSSFWQALQLEVTTIDAAQGRDYDLVVYSATRSNAAGRLGFLRDRRRLNVALSRARQLLVLVGDHHMLEHGQLDEEGNPYLALARYFREHPQETALVPLGHAEEAATFTCVARD